MELALREGRVLWYDAARGYGFIREEPEKDAVFITKTALDEFGVTGLHSGLEIVFDVVKGRASEKVKTIVLLRGENPLH